MIERRQDPDPHPPEGVSDRRNCSDPVCMAAREEWFEKTLLPRLMNKLYMTIGAAVMALAGVFLYLSQNAITKFELKIKDEYESRQHHEEDIRRLEGKFDALGAEMLTRMDRNLQAIRDLKGK